MKRAAAFTLSLLATAISPIAQDNVCNLCQAALQQELKSYDYSFDEALLRLDTLNSDEMSKMGSSTDLGVNFPIDIGSVGGNVSTDAWSESRKRLNSYNKFTSNRAESTKQIDKRITERGFNSFDNCVDACSTKGALLFLLDRKNSTEDILQFELTVRPGPGVLNIKVESSAVNGAIETEVVPKGTALDGLSRKTVQLRRSNHQTVSGFITAAPYTARFSVPPTPPRRPSPRIANLVGRTEPNGSDNYNVVFTGRLNRDGYVGNLHVKWFIVEPAGAVKNLNEIPLNDDGTFKGVNRLGNVGKPPCVDPGWVIVVTSDDPAARPLYWGRMASFQQGRPPQCGD